MCENGVVCSEPNTGEGGRDDEFQMRFATASGFASFTYSPTEIYEKKSKTVELDNAQLTVSVKSLVNQVEGAEKQAWGELYDHVTFTVAYHGDAKN